MLNYRQFEAGPDPFGRKYQVLLKWLQTGISLRHADTVDVKFILTEDSAEAAATGGGVYEGNPVSGPGRSEKTIALPHADLLTICRESGRPMDDPWCARLAMFHLLHLIQTGEDMEKNLVTVNLPDLKRYSDQLAQAERTFVQAR